MIELANLFCHLMFLMMAGHAVADWPLQGAEMSQGKRLPWPARVQFLMIHGLIHGGSVALVTGLWWLGAIETIVHAVIDNAKGQGRIGHITDQSLHIACKIIWAAIAVAVACRS